MDDERKPAVTLRGGKFATCALGGAYLYGCIHTALTIVAPADTDRDTTTLIASSSATPDTGMAFISNAITEEQVRVDMPWLKGFMTTKRSTGIPRTPPSASLA
jgi:hypothetical protein